MFYLWVYCHKLILIFIFKRLNLIKFHICKVPVNTKCNRNVCHWNINWWPQGSVENTPRQHNFSSFDYSGSMGSILLLKFTEMEIPKFGEFIVTEVFPVFAFWKVGVECLSAGFSLWSAFKKNTQLKFYLNVRVKLFQ